MSGVGILWKLIENGREGKNVGTSTGLPKLDKIIGGLQASRYYLIGAASSAGKSALALYIMYHTLKNMKDPIYFIYFSLEIGEEVLLSKLMGLYCAEEFGVYLTTNDIMSFDHILDDFSFDCLKKAKTWLNSVKDNIIILDSGLSARRLYKETIPILQKLGTIEEIGERQIYYPNNIKQKVFGIIDHMSLIRAEEGRKLKEEMDLMSSYMVTLKRKYQISWIALMQQNRDANSMDRRKADLSEPGLSDLKDSGAPSQDADVVLQIYYPARDKLTSYRGYKILGEGGLRDRHRSLIINKNRYGIANQVINTGFYGEVGWFKELLPSDQISDFTTLLDISKNIPKAGTKSEYKNEQKDEKVSNKLEFSMTDFDIN